MLHAFGEDEAKQAPTETEQRLRKRGVNFVYLGDRNTTEHIDRVG